MRVHASIEPLLWESDFFQLCSAKLNFASEAPLLSLAALEPFALVQAKIPAQRLDLADALAAGGFRLVEGEVDLSLTIGTKNAKAENANGSSLRVATAADIAALRAAAGQAFSLSRFRAPWYRSGDSSRFYSLWVEKAVLGTFDHQCLLTQDALGQPSGFVTLRDLGAGEARIGLLAVWSGAAGKGIGQQLMAAAAQWCQQRGIVRLRVATQIGNVAALRLYIRSGASIESTAYWLYRG